MKDRIRRAVLIIVFFLCILYSLILNGKTNESEWKPVGLKVELMECPYGIDTKSPAFSWYMNEDGGYQKKYEFILSSTKRAMNNEEYLIDTGWVTSKENTYVKIDNIENVLSDNSVYYWKVRVMDSDNNISEWSDVTSFATEVGIEWTSTKTIWNKEQSDYVFIRGTVNIHHKSRVEKALLSVTALSPEETRQYVYNLYMNERYVGSGPARINKGIINYNTFDVTEYLKTQNVLGLFVIQILENNFYVSLLCFMMMAQSV